jgi:hypothetical protein
MEGTDMTAYRGYLIGRNVLADIWWIEKGESFIAYAASAADARAQIDMLLDQIA